MNMCTSAIEKIRVSRFGPFDGSYDLSFVPGINVIVGDNGTGKSQLLKLLYSCTQVLQDESFEHTKTAIQRRIAEKLVGVFCPDSLGRLVTRQQGRAKTEVSVSYEGSRKPLSFSFATNSKSEVRLESMPDDLRKAVPVYLPSRELMSIYPGFVSLYNTHQLEFDETMRDTCALLGLPPLRRNSSSGVVQALQPIEAILGGRVEQVGDRFYLNGRPEGNFEMPLLAEGLRKLSTIARLVQCGVLLDKGYLFWDEPEANLNPASQIAIVQTILALAKNGIQIFLGTHSAFLLRQLFLESKRGDAPSIRLTALRRSGERGTHVDMVQGDDLEDVDLEYLAAIKTEYDQADAILAE